MKNDEENTLSVRDWCSGVKQLKELGCEFLAFYGAEPLLEFEKLCPVIEYAEAIGIDTTVITSGFVPNFREKLEVLHDHGLNSLTMSYDIKPIDTSTKEKMGKTLSGLSAFKEVCGDSLRDLAAVVTLHRGNLPYLVDTVETFTQLGIWTFFDFYHPQRHSYGTKTRGVASNLLFNDDDLKLLARVLKKLVRMKEGGYLLHTNEGFVNKIMNNDFSLLKTFSWKCSDYKEFPSWVTIDCDGSVYPCDDFNMGPQGFSITNISSEFEMFSEVAKKQVDEYCKGCVWCTHIQAHQIKEGSLGINDYVHGRK
jgi:radical SAM protein with 4Fe4S-binding SPASM domain